MRLTLKHSESKDSGFSNFIRNASAAEKKRVYKDVLEKATQRQNALLNDEKSVQAKPR